MRPVQRLAHPACFINRQTQATRPGIVIHQREAPQVFIAGCIHSSRISVVDFNDLAGLLVPAPGLNADFIAGLELFGGILLVLGLGSRLIGLMLTVNMLVAYITADREAFVSVISDPDKFTAATPYTFLFASLIVLIFGAGKLSIDAWITSRARVVSSQVAPHSVPAV